MHIVKQKFDLPNFLTMTHTIFRNCKHNFIINLNIYLRKSYAITFINTLAPKLIYKTGIQTLGSKEPQLQRYFSLYLTFFKAKIRCVCAVILFLLLAVYELIYMKHVISVAIQRRKTKMLTCLSFKKCFKKCLKFAQPNSSRFFMLGYLIILGQACNTSSQLASYRALASYGNELLMSLQH